MSEYVENIAKRAKEVSYELASLTAHKKNEALEYTIEALVDLKKHILKENEIDLKHAAEKGLNSAMLDRLKITDARFDSMIKALREIISLKDPVGEYTEIRKRYDGLQIGRMRAPLGVVFIIYESRPNVTIDAAALCFKSANAAILRGGSEAVHSNKALYTAFQKGFRRAGLNEDAVQFVSKTDREHVNGFLKLSEYIDVVVPRGGEGLINFVVSESSIPVIRHDKGLCHTYIEKDYDKDKAIEVVLNAKTSRVSVCNATETLLIHKDFPYGKDVVEALIHKGVEVRGCKKTQNFDKKVKAAKAEDWDSEYLDMIISVRVVENFEQAVSHINRHGSKHTDAILTNDINTAERFKMEVDSACVFVNASTRFSDGGEFGLGAEMGISNQKLHVRGPMGLEGLTSLKYVVVGEGHTRK